MKMLKMGFLFSLFCLLLTATASYSASSSPLSIAVRAGDKETAQRLINEGADVNVDNGAPLGSAISFYRSNNKNGLDIIDMLLANGARADVVWSWHTPFSNNTALSWAYGNAELMKIFKSRLSVWQRMKCYMLDANFIAVELIWPFIYFPSLPLLISLDQMNKKGLIDKKTVDRIGNIYYAGTYLAPSALITSCAAWYCIKKCSKK